ncbi:MAG: hypothetical protein R2849_19515 [Thermomicrobiales bacterium]
MTSLRPHEREKLQGIADELIAEGGSAEFDHEIIRRDGTVRFVHHVIAQQAKTSEAATGWSGPSWILPSARDLNSSFVIRPITMV